MSMIRWEVLVWLVWGVSGDESHFSLPDGWITLRSWLPLTLQGNSFRIGLPLIAMLVIGGLTALLLNKTNLGRQL